ncbi:IucA/IucC family protein [Streptomyces sp. AJS327]|uniref:IucA/IucC family protein n=1 Tax=Streptomyces sp. AJS327 TaxID=2545265 RepID=UPI0027E4F4FA|nr:IucA/IucC family protein [Streptomyces sp. AJS327]
MAPESPAAPLARAGEPRTGRPELPGPGGTSDRAGHPDPYTAADAATLENLLRCWVRETGALRERGGPGEGGTAPREGTLRVPLTASGLTLRVPVPHWSVTGAHRFGPPVLEGAPPEAAPLNAVTLAALLSREAAYLGDAPRSAEDTGLIARVAGSVQHTARFLAHRRATPEPPSATGAFLDSEQALLFGHPLHPTPKCREGLTESELDVYSPETRGAFALHWLAVSPELAAGDSAWTENGSTIPAALLAARAAGPSVRAQLPDGAVPLPLHPWQARELRRDPVCAALLAEGVLRDLGPAGEPWYPTSSVRTVCRPDGPMMLKLSLGLRITNSRRNNLRKELLRGVEAHRLLCSGLADEWRAAFPGFDVVRDPAWLGVDLPGGGTLAGVDTVLRHHPFAAGDDIRCVAGLLAPLPDPERPEGPPRSRLARLLEGLAARRGECAGALAAEWFRRYLERVVRPVLWLDGAAGVALEAHQQNTLVALDAEGWPVGGRYRDNQGYYFRTSHRAALERRLPGHPLGVASDSFVDDPVVDERFAYYLGINNVFGLIGALGAQGLAEERRLLAELRCFLREVSRSGAPEGASSLPPLLLDSPTLRCKANLLTRLRGMDELVGPVDTQSVYTTIRNPLAD